METDGFSPRFFQPGSGMPSDLRVVTSVTQVNRELPKRYDRLGSRQPGGHVVCPLPGQGRRSRSVRYRAVQDQVWATGRQPSPACRRQGRGKLAKRDGSV